MYVLSAPSTGCGPAGSLPTPDLPFIRDLVLRVSAAEEDSDKPHPRWSEPDSTCLVLHQGWGAVWVLQAGGHQPLSLDVAADLWQGLDLSCTSCVALPLVRLSASVAARPPSVWTLGSSGSLAKAYCPAQAARESLAPRNKRLARCMWSLASPWRSPNRCNSPAPARSSNTWPSSGCCCQQSHHCRPCKKDGNLPCALGVHIAPCKLLQWFSAGSAGTWSPVFMQRSKPGAHGPPAALHRLFSTRVQALLELEAPRFLQEGGACGLYACLQAACSWKPTCCPLQQAAAPVHGGGWHE